MELRVEGDALHEGTTRDREAGQGSDDAEDALSRRRILPGEVHDPGQRLHERTQRAVPSLASLDRQRRERAAELLQVAAQVVLERGGGLRRVAGIVHGGGPVGDAVGALLVQDGRRADRIVAEDLRESLLPLSIRQATEAFLQDPGEAFEADELALRVVCADAQLFHLLRRLPSGIGEREQHGLERGASVGAEQASGREGGQAADGFLDRQAELRGDEAGLLECHAEVVDAAHRLPCASGKEVRDVRDFVAGQLELRHGRRGDPGGLSNLDLTRSGQRQSAIQATPEHVGGGHASADELLDAVGCLDRRVGGVGTGLLRSFGQGVDVLAGVVTGGGDTAHRLVEVRVLAGDQSDSDASCGT